MMRAIEPVVFDFVWNLIKDLIPERPARPQGGGRRRVPDRICFEAMFWRHITGEAWETIEARMNHTVSDTTLRTRRNEWANANILGRLFEKALTIYNNEIGLDLEHVCIDGTTQLAPGGGQDTGISYKSGGRQAINISLATDNNGIPIAFEIAPGNRNDYALLEPTLNNLFARPITPTIGTLHLDRGYGYPGLPAKVAHYPITNLDYPPRNQPNTGRTKRSPLKRRWIVERTNAWLTNFGQLRRNTDRKTSHRHDALNLAATILIAYKLTHPNHTT